MNLISELDFFHRCLILFLEAKTEERIGNMIERKWLSLSQVESIMPFLKQSHKLKTAKEIIATVKDVEKYHTCQRCLGSGLQVCRLLHLQGLLQGSPVRQEDDHVFIRISDDQR